MSKKCQKYPHQKKVFPASIGLLTCFFVFFTCSLPLLPPTGYQFWKIFKIQNVDFSLFLKKNVIFPRKNGRENRYFWSTTGKNDFSKFEKFSTVFSILTRKIFFGFFCGKNWEKNWRIIKMANSKTPFKSDLELSEPL